MENNSDIKTEKSFTAVTADSLQTNMGKKKEKYICYLDKKVVTSTSRFMPPQLSHKPRNQTWFLKHYLQQKKKRNKHHLPHTP